MLAEDTRQRREATLDRSGKTLQSDVTDHFRPESKAEKPITYSDNAFACAAIEWLIDGGLVSISLSHLSKCCADSLELL